MCVFPTDHNKTIFFFHIISRIAMHTNDSAENRMNVECISNKPENGGPLSNEYTNIHRYILTVVSAALQSN